MQMIQCIDYFLDCREVDFNVAMDVTRLNVVHGKCME